MEVKYDRMACDGWFQCTQEWDAFEMDPIAGKADLEGSKVNPDDLLVRSVPEEHEDAAKAAAESCPVDAIKIYNKDGEQIVP
jgi:ferredoxin